MPAHILVVDDHRCVRETLQFILEAEGYEVETAANGQQALDRIAAQRPDLVLTDLQMPGMSGWELGRHVTALGLAIPVIFMSVDPAVATLATTHGADAYLVKPFEAGDLLTAASRLAPAA